MIVSCSPRHIMSLIFALKITLHARTEDTTGRNTPVWTSSAPQMQYLTWTCTYMVYFRAAPLLYITAPCVFMSMPASKTLQMHYTCTPYTLCAFAYIFSEVCVCVRVFSYLSQLAVLHTQPQALSIGQGVASLGCGGLAGRGRGAVAHRPPSCHHHLTAGLVLI